MVEGVSSIEDESDDVTAGENGDGKEFVSREPLLCKAAVGKNIILN